MVREFREHLARHFSFLNHKKILIAISGGVDSVVLTHLFYQLGIDFFLGHCNFKLRGKESDEDEKFIMALSENLGKKIFTTSFDTEHYAGEQKMSIQAAARELRYHWFHTILKANHLDYVLTAHNTNDNLETFIINLTRGTGLDGLTGIPPVNDTVVRPLLEFSRTRIMAYAIAHNIVWREDTSNASVKYTRNKIRHRIFPVLEDINPEILDSFKNTVSYLYESQQISAGKIEKVSNRVIVKDPQGILKLNISELKKIPYLKTYLYQVLKEYGFTAWDDIFQLLSAQSGKQVFSEKYRLLKDRTYLILAPIHKTVTGKEFLIQKNNDGAHLPVSLSITESKRKKVDESTTILVDKNLLNYPLRVRKWNHGDYLCPTGMEGTKKVSRFFKDRKLSLIDKENVWLLTDANDTIIWIIGMRQDRRFGISENTKKIVKITTVS